MNHNWWHIATELRAEENVCFVVDFQIEFIKFVSMKEIFLFWIENEFPGVGEGLLYLIISKYKNIQSRYEKKCNHVNVSVYSFEKAGVTIHNHISLTILVRLITSQSALFWYRTKQKHYGPPLIISNAQKPDYTIWYPILTIF